MTSQPPRSNCCGHSQSYHLNGVGYCTYETAAINSRCHCKEFEAAAPKEQDWRAEFRERFAAVEFAHKNDGVYFISRKDEIESFIEEKIAEALKNEYEGHSRQEVEGERRAYEKGFQAGHAKERWLKDEVEKEARAEGFAEGFSEAIKSIAALKEKK